jgi:alkanesulfonate monooxygenase SsuD/methylene tetrahydromethanopterin reductase-like flavin-dependent oxidoreductase (luciferase family)
VAGVTEKIRLGTSLLDFPMYAPARLAKRIATLDVLPDGRTVVCGGLGWSEDEYVASNVPFEKRGARLTEFVQALLALWSPDTEVFFDFNGRCALLKDGLQRIMEQVNWLRGVV